MDDDFLGAHAAVFVGDELLVILRDDSPSIPSPNCWDFPGGTRDDAETPIETLIREVREEVGLVISEQNICHAVRYQSRNQPDRINWFFVVQLDWSVRDQIVLGDEGQGWALMPPDEYLKRPNVVPSFPPQLIAWLGQQQA